jgi:hypothetical protein
VVSPVVSGWRGTSRGVERDVGEIHNGRTVEIDEPLLLQAPHTGTFELAWVFTSDIAASTAGVRCGLLCRGQRSGPRSRSWRASLPIRI